jgi:GxxExxY protein
MEEFNLNKLTEKIIGIAIDIHKELGPGFAEKVYQRIMYLELKRNSLGIEREYKITVHWNKNIVGYHVVDFLINNSIIVEIKATAETQEIHKYQLLSYLKAADKRLGLLLNFGSGTLGIKRVVNKL